MVTTHSHIAQPEIVDIVARAMNILETTYGVEDLDSMGMPTVQEVATAIYDAYQGPKDAAQRVEP